VAIHEAPGYYHKLDRIMSNTALTNCIRQRRLDRHWSQQELSDVAGVPRANISGIEVGRLVPSTATALALAAALHCRVEDLFQLDRPADEPGWAWQPPGPAPHRFWIAEVGGRRRLFPAEATHGAASPHDGVAVGTRLDLRTAAPPPTLIVASCDPAAELLAAEVARTAGIRVLTFFRSSRAALELLKQRLVHVAGLHLGKTGEDDNSNAVAAELGPGYMLVRASEWEEGVVTSTPRREGSLSALARSSVRWIAREPGSGARQCFDELVEGRVKPRRVATNHAAVATAVGGGWADAGVCPRLVAEEAALPFYSIRREEFDLCLAADDAADPRIGALVSVLRSANYRRLIDDLPGYSSRALGETVSPAGEGR
jgi:molybdate-binding protein/DNA-binding XRE family transcriptional regulator